MKHVGEASVPGLLNLVISHKSLVNGRLRMPSTNLLRMTSSMDYPDMPGTARRIAATEFV